MTRGLRRWLLTLLAIAGVLTTSVAIPAGADGASAVQTIWSRYDFHSARPGLLQVDGHMDPAPGAFFATVTVFGSHTSEPHATFASVLDLDAFDEMGTYGAAGNRDFCPGAATCVVRAGQLTFRDGFQVFGGSRQAADISVYIVARGANVVIHDRVLDHWKANHRTGGVVRRTVSDASGAGVIAASQTVGANLGVSAPGAAGGSVAIAVPGCDEAGAGLFMLTGGLTGETTICPSDLISAVAKKATTWKAAGAVAGWSGLATRLVVLRS